MAKSVSRRVSAQETTIAQDEPSQSQFECPICMYWLNEPVLTSCGHRFCKKCISTWLKKPNPRCPIDNKELSENDLFPDNYTRREIQQIRKSCPNVDLGCQVTVSPLELDAHVMQCLHRPQHECLFKTCGCTFQTADPNEINIHLHSEMPTHLNLLMTAFAEKQQSHDLKSLEASNHDWDAPSKDSGCSNGDNSTTDLVKALYERIVVLEQHSREKDLKIDKLAQQIAKATLGAPQVQPRYSCGVLVWKIMQFQSKINAMSADPNVMFYSGEAYTSPHGYRYCVRINISPKFKDFIGLHVHLMKSDNDFHLDWPFRGRIKISMIHRNLNETKHDIIMSKPEILAFHRPSVEISPRGFGFLEYASISHVLNKGFVIMDTLTVKIQLSIV